MVVGISRKIQDLGSVIWGSGSKQLANLSRSMASIAIFVRECLGLGDGGRGVADSVPQETRHSPDVFNASVRLRG